MNDTSLSSKEKVSRWLVVAGGDGYETHICEGVEAMERKFLEVHFGPPLLAPEYTRGEIEEMESLLGHLRNENHWTSNSDLGRVSYSIRHEDGCVDVIRLTDESPTDEPSAELYAEVIRLREEVKGPDGFATWKDAAVSERVKRVELERRISEPPAHAHNEFRVGDSVRTGPWPHLSSEYSHVMKITGVLYYLDHEFGPYNSHQMVRVESTKSACTCGTPDQPGVLHRLDGVCYVTTPVDTPPLTIDDELERLEFAPPADPGPVQTFEPNGPERGFATMCANCGQIFGKHIAQDHSGNSSVCPAPETSGPADLVGALQDVVHTDSGPVRAGRSVRSGETSGGNS